MDTTLVEPVTPAPIPARRRITKIALLSLTVVLGGWLMWSAWQVWFTPDGRVQQIYLVPDDAAVVLHSSDPVGDWRQLTQSAPWQSLSRAESMVGFLCHKITFEQVLGDATYLALVRAIFTQTHLTLDTAFTHQPKDGLMVNRVALPGKLRRDTPIAVTTTMLVIDFCDQGFRVGIFIRHF